MGFFMQLMLLKSTKQNEIPPLCRQKKKKTEKGDFLCEAINYVLTATKC
jgi:hypothetical protein